MYHTIDLHFQNFEHAIASFLIETNEGPILIETGPYSTIDSLKEGLKKRGYDIEEIKHVLLTHIHFDHAGAAWYFAKNGANIYLHPFGVRHMHDPSKLLASATMIYGDQMDVLWGKMEGIAQEKLLAVEHNQTLEIGGKQITALHTPGHAKHHIAWQYDNKIFTGDVGGVKIDGGPVVPPCPPPDISLEDWEASMELIMNRDPDHLILTHYGEISHPKSHFEELAKILNAWAIFIKEKWEAGYDQDRITSMFMDYTKKDLMSKGVTEEAVKQYEAANPSWMSVAGLIRYWNKKAKA